MCSSIASWRTVSAQKIVLAVALVGRRFPSCSWFLARSRKEPDAGTAGAAARCRRPGAHAASRTPQERADERPRRERPRATATPSPTATASPLIRRPRRLRRCRRTTMTMTAAMMTTTAAATTEATTPQSPQRLLAGDAPASCWRSSCCSRSPRRSRCWRSGSCSSCAPRSGRRGAHPGGRGVPPAGAREQSARPGNRSAATSRRSSDLPAPQRPGRGRDRRRRSSTAACTTGARASAAARPSCEELEPRWSDLRRTARGDVETSVGSVRYLAVPVRGAASTAPSW